MAASVHPEKQKTESISASWDVLLADKNYRVDFIHGTISGKRVILLNGTEIYRKKWLVSLVGEENFNIGKNKVKITIYPQGMDFEYILYVEGKPLDKFVQTIKKSLIVWIPLIGNTQHRVCLDKNNYDIYVNGDKLEDVDTEFTDEGTETYFYVGEEPAVLKNYSSGVKRQGLVYELNVGNADEVVPISQD